MFNTFQYDRIDSCTASAKSRGNSSPLKWCTGEIRRQYSPCRTRPKKLGRNEGGPVLSLYLLFSAISVHNITCSTWQSWIIVNMTWLIKISRNHNHKASQYQDFSRQCWLNARRNCSKSRKTWSIPWCWVEPPGDVPACVTCLYPSWLPGIQ